jgi:hypothetical protein
VYHSWQVAMLVDAACCTRARVWVKYGWWCFQGVGPTPHNVRYKPGFFSVNTLKERKDGPFSEPPTFTRLALHHYSVKSEEEYMNKRARGSGTGNMKGLRYWNIVHTVSDATCLDAVQLGRVCCSYEASSVRDHGV